MAEQAGCHEARPAEDGVLASRIPGRPVDRRRAEVADLVEPWCRNVSALPEPRRRTPHADDPV